MSKKKGFRLIYDFVLGHIHSHPGLHAACGWRVGHPEEHCHSTSVQFNSPYNLQSHSSKI